MKIVADKDIFAVERIFSPLGELVLLPGRAISPRDVKDADALLVRSVCPVNQTLLAGAAVKFVGSATSGTDHLDSAWLRGAGIAVADTRGANAGAVVEYCLGAIARMILEGRLDRGFRSIGIIGAGAVGGRLARVMAAFGVDTVICDPPLAATAPRSRGYRPLAAALNCDVVSLHVPLTQSGRHATNRLIDGAALARLRPGALLLQTSRGGLVDEEALRARLALGSKPRSELSCVIDVWRGEPAIDFDLAAKADLATPHIAGYSEQAKWAASLSLARQMADFFQLPAAVPAGPPIAEARIAIDPAWLGDGLAHWRVIDRVMSLASVSRGFKRWAATTAAAADAGDAARDFDGMRRPLVQRRAFSAIRLTGAEQLAEEERRPLRHAGFRIQAKR